MGMLGNAPALGLLQAANLAPGAAVGNLGFTPVNKAGDTMGGVLTLNGQVRLSNSVGDIIRTGSFVKNNPGDAYVTDYTEYIGPSGLNVVEFGVYVGVGPTNARTFWNLNLSTGLSTWMDMFRVEVQEGNWSYGQQVGYKEFFVSASSNSWLVVNGANNYDRNNFSNVGFGATPVSTTYVKFGGSNSSGGNLLRYKITSPRQWVSNGMTMYFNTTTPF